MFDKRFLEEARKRWAATGRPDWFWSKPMARIDPPASPQPFSCDGCRDTTFKISVESIHSVVANRNVNLNRYVARCSCWGMNGCGDDADEALRNLQIAQREDEKRLREVDEKRQRARELLQAWRQYENCPGMGFPDTEEFLDRFFRVKK